MPAESTRVNRTLKKWGHLKKWEVLVANRSDQKEKGRQLGNHTYKVKLRNMPNYKCILDFTVTRSKGQGKVLSHHYPLCEIATVQKLKWSMVQEPPPLLSNHLTELSSIGAKILNGRGLKEATN